jgi:hypothetical protein
MESPPPYMPPRKKSNTGLIVGIVIGVVLLCCIAPIGVIVGGGLWVFNKSKGLIQCTYAFRDVREGLREYAAEHDGKLPPADNWQEDVAPYYTKVVSKSSAQDRKMFGVMPASGTWGCDDGSNGLTGMALNDDVAGKDVSKLEMTTDVVLFEVRQATRNAHQKYVADAADSPKIFGSSRGWFLIRMSGEPMLTKHGKEVPVNTGPNGD